MSTTPRTDAAIHRADTISNASGLLRAKYKGLEMEYVSPDFVRQLETEIQQLTAKLAQVRYTLKQHHEHKPADYYGNMD